jgi:intracellular sulfur oxidation DsrE/DsrF family protein
MRLPRSTLFIAVLATAALLLIGGWALYQHFRYGPSDGTDALFAKLNKRENHNDSQNDVPVKLEFPIITGYGGVVPTPGAAEPPRKGGKVVFDVTANAKEPGKVVPALERVAMLLNLGGLAGLKPADFQITVVLYGQATTAALSDGAYAKNGGGPNPNSDLLRQLKAAGVEVFVCGQALARKGFEPKDVRPDVRIATAALTVVMNKQAEGFAYVPAH